jgi:PilZ domain
MLSDRRRSTRHAISRLAKLQIPGSTLPRDCLVTNISDGGVRLHVEGVEVPDHFVLLISDGDRRAVPRDCRVVWRLGFELGAEFLDASGRPTRKRDLKMTPTDALG